MEHINQLNAWAEQIKDCDVETAAADMGVARRLLDHALEAHSTMKQLRAVNANLLDALEGVLPFLTGNYWPGAEADAAVKFAISAAREAHNNCRGKQEPSLRLINDLLDPEIYGHAVSPEVRDRARKVLGIAPCETNGKQSLPVQDAGSFNQGAAWRDALEAKP